MTELGDDFRAMRKHKRKMKNHWDNKFFSKVLPDIKEFVNDLGLKIDQLSHSHFRIKVGESYIDFWQTLTYKVKDRDSSFGLDGLKKEIMELSTNHV